jgi:hypothetical protein
MSTEGDKQYLLPEWLRKMYAELDREVDALVSELKSLGFSIDKMNHYAHSYSREISETRELKVIIYQFAGTQLGRGGIAVQEIESGSVVTQAMFNDTDYSNICKRIMGLVRASIPVE